MTTGRSPSLLTLLICLCLLLSLESSAPAQQRRPAGATVASKPDVKMLPPALRVRGQALLDEKDEQNGDQGMLFAPVSSHSRVGAHSGSAKL